MNILKKINDIIYGSSNGKRIHSGIVRTINISKLTEGRILITDFGIGRIIKVIPANQNIDNKPTVDVRIDKIGTVHRLGIKVLKKHVVYHNGNFVEILPADYYYIGLDNQEIEYYITGKGYAKLIEECIEKYKFFTIFHKFRNGRNILLTLYKNRFKIIKQDDTEEIGKRYIVTRFHHKQRLSQ